MKTSNNDDNMSIRNPVHAWIEPTNRCNTRCIHCGHYYSVFGADMDGATYSRVQAELIPELERVSLIGYGEPLMASMLDDMLSDCISKGLKIHITTNGLLLNNETLVEKLVKNNVSLNVSIDGATKNVYEFVRPYIKWERLMESLQCLRAARQKQPGSAFQLHFNFVAMKKTVGDLPALVRLAHDYGVKQIEVLPLGGYEDLERVRDQSLNDVPEQRDAAFSAAYDEAIKLGIQLNLPDYSFLKSGASRQSSVVKRLLHVVGVVIRLIKNRDMHGVKAGVARLVNWRVIDEIPYAHRCSFPWRDTYIAANGDVSPCCILGCRLGNLHETDWKSIWRGAAYNTLRKTIHSWNPSAICRYCSLPAGINSGDEKRYEKRFRDYGSMVIPWDQMRLVSGDSILNNNEGLAVMHIAELEWPMDRRAVFLRWKIVPSEPGIPGRSGMVSVNSGEYHPFDTSCPDIHIPLFKIRSRRIKLSIQMDESDNDDVHRKDVALQIKDISFLFAYPVK